MSFPRKFRIDFKVVIGRSPRVSFRVLHCDSSSLVLHVEMPNMGFFLMFFVLYGPFLFLACLSMPFSVNCRSQMTFMTN